MRQFAAFRVFATSVVALLMALLPLSAVQAQVFSNNAPISIPSSGTATPYPSTINVTGVPGGSIGLRVRLKNFTHTFPADVGVLLVSPSNQSYQLIAPIPTSGGNPVSNITLTLTSDFPATPLPNPLVTGTFAGAGGLQAYAPPATGFTRRPDLIELTGGNRNGAWRLFVQDFAAGDFGSFAGGWEIEFIDNPAPLATNAFTYQGRLDGGITDGFIDARFSLWNSRNSGEPINLLAGPVDMTGIPISGGLFTARVDLGIPVPTNVQTFLQVEVASPSGSGYIALSPRQPMTAAPLASIAAGLGSATSLPGGNILSSGPTGIGFTGTNANIGIGTTAPVANLDVRGSIALGNAGQLRAASGEENLRIIRGEFLATGAILRGSGFTVTRLEPGLYRVTFTTAFSDSPTVTATAFTSVNQDFNVVIQGVGASLMTLRAFNASGTSTDSSIHFIAIGPR